MNKAVGYIRVSTDKQDYERQRGEILEYAKKEGFTITTIFEDKESGSEYEGRDGFQDLLIHFDENLDTKIVIFDEISRMGRDTAEQASTYKVLQKKGVVIYTRGKGKFDDSKEDNLLFSVLSAIAEYEKKTLIDRTSSGRRKVVKDGFTQISNRPFGYNINYTDKTDLESISRQTLSTNDEEANVVREMFRIIDEGGHINDVRRYLSECGVMPVKAEKWPKSSVTRILHSTTYYGKWAYGKYRKNGKTKYSLTKRNPEDYIYVDVPQIIDRELFDRVQKKLSDSRSKFNKKNLKDSFLLKGIMHCECGSIMNCVSESSRTPRSYRCPQRNLRGLEEKTCPLNFLKADFLEKILLQEVQVKISDDAFMQEEKLQDLDKYREPVKKLEDEEERLKNKIEKEEGKLQVMYEKIAELTLDSPEKADAMDNVVEKISKQVKELRSRHNDISTKIKRVQGESIDYGMFGSIRESLAFIQNIELKKIQEGSGDEKTKFVRSYIRSIDAKVLESETKAIQKEILSIRDKGLYSKGNEDLRELYLSVANREHKVRRNALQVIELSVEFVNNYTMKIRFPYLHKNPDIALNYFRSS